MAKRRLTKQETTNGVVIAGRILPHYLRDVGTVKEATIYPRRSALRGGAELDLTGELGDKVIEMIHEVVSKGMAAVGRERKARLKKGT